MASLTAGRPPRTRRPALLAFVAALGLALAGSATASADTLSGHVKSSTGVAISNATVELMTVDTETVVGSASSTLDGSYSVTVPAGSYDVKVTPPPFSTYATLRIAGRAVSGATVLQLQLSSSVTFSGTLKDPSGAAIPNTYIGVAGTYVYTTSTGAFSFVVTPGTHSIEIYGSGSSGTKVPNTSWNLFSQVAVGSSGLALPITVPTLAVDTLVVRPDGTTPVTGTALQSSASTGGNGSLVLFAGDTNGRGSYATTATTGADGHGILKVFRTAGTANSAVPPASATGLAGVTFDLSGTTADTTKTVTLTDGVPFSGTFKDPAGNPVVNSTLTMSKGGVATSRTTDAEGRYSFSLTPGAYALAIRGGSAAKLPAGNWGLDTSISLSTTGTTGLALTAPSVTVDLLVRRPDGTPVSGAIARSATNPSPPGSLSLFPGDTQGYGYANSAQATSDATGHANLVIFPVAGSAGNSVTPPAGAPDLAQTAFSLSGITADTARTVTMLQSVPLSGVLRDRLGAPVPNVYMSVSGNGISTATSTNSSGAFSVSVRPGTYTFYFSGNSSAAKVPKGSWYLQSSVTVPAAGRTGFDVTVPGLAVDVTVVGRSGNPVPGSVLRATGSGSAVLYPGDIQGYASYSQSAATTGADGHANLIILPVGGSSNTATPPANTTLPAVGFSLAGYTRDSSLVISFQESTASTTPPAISCAAADGDWHAVNVSRACTASSPTPGLAKPSTDASFNLTTSVPDGTHTDDARTGSKKVCDLADNCSVAGPLTANKVDRRAPVVTFTAPADGKHFHQGDVVDAAFTCTDGTGAGVATCEGDGGGADGRRLDTSQGGTFTYTVTSTDAVGNRRVATRSYGVTDPDEQPEVAASVGSAAWTEGDNVTSTPVVVDPSVTVADIDDDNLASATVAVTDGFAAGEDVLGFATQNGITSSYDGTSGVLTLTGPAAQADWEAALSSVTYTNSSEDPSLADRTISFRVDDGTIPSVAATRTVTITAVDDAPVVAGAGGSTAWSEGNVTASIPVPVAPGLTVADSDSASLASATVALAGGFAAGEDVLGFVNQLGITGAYDSATGILTLTGPATRAQWQTALRSVTYDNTHEPPTTADRTVTFTISDGNSAGDEATQTVTLTALDDAPTVVSPNLPVNTGDLPLGTNGTVNALARSGSDLYLGGQFSGVGPLTGNGALLSASSGAAAALSGPNSNVNAIVPDGAGGWYIGGDFTMVGTVARNRLAHLLPDGSVDPSFDPNPNSSVHALTLSGTTLYVGGTFTQVHGSVTRNRLAAFDTTQPSPNLLPFNPNFNSSVISLAVSGSTLFAGGHFSQVNGSVNRNRLAAFDTTQATANVTAFDPRPNSSVYALALKGSTLYAGGSFTQVDGATTRNRMAAFDTTQPSAPALAFNPNVNDTVYALAVSGTTLYAGGAFYYANASVYRAYAAAFDTTQDTANLTDFDPQPNSHVLGLALVGPILYIGGHFNYVTGNVPRNRLAAFDTRESATSATDFNPSMGSSVLAVGATGSAVYAGGSFTIANMAPRNNIARIDTATNTVSAFDPNVNSAVNTLLLSGDTLYAGGSFTNVNGNMPRNRLAGFDVRQPINSVTDFDPNVNSTVSALAMAGTTLYAGGSFTQVNGAVPRGRLASFDTTLNVSNVTGADPNLNNSVNALLRSGTVLYAGGSFTQVGTTVRNRLAALDTRSPVLAPTSFDPNVNGSVHALLLSGSRLYAGGSFSQVNGSASRGNVAAFDTALATSNATPFNPVTNSTVHALSMSANSLFLGGSFTTVNGNVARQRLAAVETTRPTANVMSFDPSINGTVLALSTAGGTLHAGGSFSSLRSGAQANLTRFTIPAVGFTNWTEGNNIPSVAVPIDDRLLVGDADSPALATARVTVTGNYSPTEDVLSFANDLLTMGNVAIASNAGGVLALASADATATVEQWQAALRAVKYGNTSQTPSTATRTVHVEVSDGNSTSTVAERQMLIASVDDTPTLAATAGSTAWLEDAQPSSKVAVDPGIDTADLDSPNLTSASVSISAGLVAAQDALSFSAQDGISGAYDATTGVLSLSGSATKAAWTSVLRTVRYDNSSNTPTGTSRTISFAVSDGNSTAATVTKALALTATDDPPVVTTTGGTTSWTEADNATSTPVTVDTGLTLSDVDSTTLSSATVTIAGNHSASEDVLSFGNDLISMGNIAVSSNSGGVLTLTSAGSSAGLAQWQSALRAVRYSSTSDTPSTLDRTLEFRARSSVATSLAAVKTVSLTSVNDAPVLAASGSVTFTEGNNVASTPVAVAPAITTADADHADLRSAKVSITSSPALGEDRLRFTDGEAITGTYETGTGVLTLTGTATKAAWASALRSVTYANDSEAPTAGDRTVSFELSDGAKTSAAVTRTVSVVAVDDTPQLSGLTAVTWTEGDNAASTPVALGSGAAISDTDSATMASATVAITGAYRSAEDVLAFEAGSDSGNIAATANTGGVLTLTSAGATATKAQWLHALSRVTYDNTSEAPDGADRTVTVRIHDGSSASAPRTLTVQIAGVDDVPIVVTTSTPVAWTEADNATSSPVAVDDALSLSDTDSADFTSATVSLDPFFAGEDVLAFADQNGITGAFEDGVLTMSGTASVADWRAALRSVTYNSTSDTPGGDRTVEIAVSDGNATSAAAQRTIARTAVNDTPTLVADAGAATWTEVDNAATVPVAVSPGLLVTDPDHDNLQSATVTVTDAIASEDVLGFTDQNGIEGDYDAATGVLTLTGPATKLEYRAALRSVTYDNTSETPSGDSRSIAFAASDGTATSSNVTRTVDLTAVDDTPVLTLSEEAGLAYTEQADPVAFDAGLAVADADDTDLESATVTIQSGRGTGDTLSFTPVDGITGEFSADEGTLEFTGAASKADYQAVLRSVSFSNDLDAPSDAVRVIGVVTSDGTKTSASVTRELTFTAVDDAPVLTAGSGALSYTEGQAATAVDPELDAGDVDSTTLTGATVTIADGLAPGEDVLGFTDGNGITAGYDAATGVLTLDGSASVEEYRDALRSVTYANTSTGPSVTDRTIAFRARSSSGAESVAVTRQVQIGLNAPANVTAPTVPATAREGLALSSTEGTWTGSTPLTTATRWQRCEADGSACADIDDAAGTSYTPAAADIGRRLRVVVAATNPHSVVEAASQLTRAVRPRETAPTLLSAPAPISSDPAAAITWSGEDGATFACSVDGAAATACVSPFTPAGLADGPHTVTISQTNDGVTGPDLVVRWVLDTTAPAAPAITGGPEGDVEGRDATFGFAAPEAGGTFECRVDGAPFAACTSPHSATVTNGPHTFAVQFVDEAGNRSRAAVRIWTAGVAPVQPQVPAGARGTVGGSDGTALGTVHVDGDRVAVGCSLEQGSIQHCDVHAYAASSRGRAGALNPLKIGQGHVKIPLPGVRQVPVAVKLSERGMRLLRRLGPNTVVRFNFSVRPHASTAVLRASALARLTLPDRFVIGAKKGFATNSVSLDPSTRRQLRRVARQLAKWPRRVTCAGHTDGSATRSHSLRLGRRRAAAVCRYLRKRGVTARMRVVSHGKSRPVATNDTSAGRARNRRVEVTAR